MLDYRQLHIQALAPVLEKHPEIMLGYVFGSYLCREKYRDVDIAILLDDGKESLTLQNDTLGCNIGEALSLGCNVDLVILNDAAVEFCHNVIKNGSLFFARDDQVRIAFETKILDEFMDYRETLSWFDAQGEVHW
jgi:uncharacterized protein